MSRLVLYIQENAITARKTPYIDFAGFLAYRQNRFELFCTRNPVQRLGEKELTEVKPSLTMTFDTLDGVVTFLKSVLDWEASKISWEFHAVRNYSDVAFNFSDLWAYTSVDTELASFDDEKLPRLRNALRTLAESHVDAVDYIERV